VTEPSAFEDLIRRVRAGDEAAAAELVRRYETLVRRTVRLRLRDPRLQRLLDSVDICQSVLASFFARAALGQFELNTPQDLCRLLTAMACKFPRRAPGIFLHLSTRGSTIRRSARDSASASSRGRLAMSSPGSISYWIGHLKAGDHAAAQALWERYFGRLMALARGRLRAAPRRAADEEDVALSAFDSFARAAAHGRFPQLLDRDDLWQLLVVITARKASTLANYERRQKRGGGRVYSEAVLAGDGSAEDDAGLAPVASGEPSPEFAAQVAEECQRLLGRLDDPDLRAVALWKMEGYTNEEIAAKLGCVVRTVERRLRVIRSLWDEEDAR
jgi:DNA-directed RNA polymerase specialized sigma24 family protein